MDKLVKIKNFDKLNDDLDNLQKNTIAILDNIPGEESNKLKLKIKNCDTVGMLLVLTIEALIFIKQKYDNHE